MFSVTIKTERVDEDNLESVSDLPNAEDSQLNLEMDDDGKPYHNR